MGSHFFSPSQSHGGDVGWQLTHGMGKLPGDQVTIPNSRYSGVAPSLSAAAGGYSNSGYNSGPVMSFAGQPLPGQAQPAPAAPAAAPAAVPVTAPLGAQFTPGGGYGLPASAASAYMRPTVATPGPMLPMAGK
jgi:hypothetical protein